MITGGGKLLYAEWGVTTPPLDLYPKMEIDGVEIMDPFRTMGDWQLWYCADGSGIGFNVSKYEAESDVMCLQCTLPLPFRKSIRIGFRNTSVTQDYITSISLYVSKIA
jgi:hypothetical protein